VSTSFPHAARRTRPGSPNAYRRVWAIPSASEGTGHARVAARQRSGSIAAPARPHGPPPDQAMLTNCHRLKWSRMVAVSMASSAAVAVVPASVREVERPQRGRE
jgi:hypothetical protein